MSLRFIKLSMKMILTDKSWLVEYECVLLCACLVMFWYIDTCIPVNIHPYQCHVFNIFQYNNTFALLSIYIICTITYCRVIIVYQQIKGAPVAQGTTLALHVDSLAFPHRWLGGWFRFIAPHLSHVVHDGWLVNDAGLWLRMLDACGW